MNADLLVSRADDGEDAARVLDDASMTQWAQELGVTREALESAIRAVGPWADQVEAYVDEWKAQPQLDG